MPTEQRIALAMIVRDAEQHVERCIDSVLPVVSRWTVIDTGSVDRTKAVVKRKLRGLPGRLLEREWIGHAHNRSELLAAVREDGDADYVLMMDADTELVVDGDKPQLTEDSYLIPIHDRGMIYPLPLLTKVTKPFYYEGAAHCFLACREPAGWGRLSGWKLIDHGGGGSRPGKIERDAKALAEAVAKDPSDARSWFYLGQSLRDLDRVDEAIAAYRMRSQLGGFQEEVYNALLNVGTLLCEHRDARQGMQVLLDAWLLLPHRAEALRSLSNVARNVADKLSVPEDDLLFVFPHCYGEPTDESVKMKAA